MANRRKLTPEAVLAFKNVSDAQISPDGKSVAFVMGDQFVGDTKLPRSNLWTVSPGTGEFRQLTNGPRADTTPRWSPDGKTLAFLSDREEDGRRQIFLLPVTGGEALPLTHMEGAVPSHRGLNPMAWSPDGGKIAFLKTDPESQEEKRRKQDRDDYIDFEREPKYTSLYTVDVDAGAVECVSPDGLQIWEFCWSSSGDGFAVVASDLPFEHSWYGCRLVKVPGNGEPAQTLYDVTRQVAKPVWSPDGSLIAFLSSNWSDRNSVGGGVFVVSSEGGEARELSAGHAASATWLEWAGDSRRLIATAHDRGGFAVAEIDVATGDRSTLWRGDAMFAEQSWAQFSRDRAGNIAVVREDDANPRDIWLARHEPGGLDWKQLTRLHGQVGELEIGKVETVRWEGADSWDMQGLLIRPPGTESGGPYPMVVVVHGGPTSVHSHQFYASRGWYQLLAAQGLAVFLPNPRGSTGWGLEFAESNIGDMGGKDWEDIQLGIAHCIERDIADRDRLGIAGWSYGGFMTAWAVTQTDMFKAAMMGAGISDWRSFHGKTSLSEWDVMYYGDADPWDPDGIFQRFSPINYVKQVRTPTLILHGEEDLDVPVEQGYIFYRALRDLGVETQLVVYPREPHGFQEKNHLLDLGRRISEWFARHLAD